MKARLCLVGMLLLVATSTASGCGGAAGELILDDVEKYLT